MSEIHPHWQSTDGETVHVRTRVKEITLEGSAENTATVSRKPAAIVGMLVVLISGAVAFQAVDFRATGQVSDQKSVNVSITSSGFVPKTIDVEHGQTITWTNETGIGHALKSDTLCSNTGFCLQTTSLAKDGKGSFTITPDIPAGSYTYASITDASVAGTIDVITTAAVNFQDLPPPTNNTSRFPVNPNAPTSETATAGSIFNPLDGNASAVPVNPYAIGSVKTHPFDDSGEPKVSVNPDKLAEQKPPIFQNGRGPVRQPTTGAEMWLVIAGSFTFLWVYARRTMRAFTVIRV